MFSSPSFSFLSSTGLNPWREPPKSIDSSDDDTAAVTIQHQHVTVTQTQTTSTVTLSAPTLLNSVKTANAKDFQVPALCPSIPQDLRQTLMDDTDELPGSSYIEDIPNDMEMDPTPSVSKGKARETTDDRITKVVLLEHPSSSAERPQSRQSNRHVDQASRLQKKAKRLTTAKDLLLQREAELQLKEQALEALEESVTRSVYESQAEATELRAQLQQLQKQYAMEKASFDEDRLHMSEASSELEKKYTNMEHEANSLRQQLAQNVSNMSAKDDLLKLQEHEVHLEVDRLRKEVKVLSQKLPRLEEINQNHTTELEEKWDNWKREAHNREVEREKKMDDLLDNLKQFLTDCRNSPEASGEVRIGRSHQQSPSLKPRPLHKELFQRSSEPPEFHGYASHPRAASVNRQPPLRRSQFPGSPAPPQLVRNLPHGLNRPASALPPASRSIRKSQLPEPSQRMLFHSTRSNPLAPSTSSTPTASSSLRHQEHIGSGIQTKSGALPSQHSRSCLRDGLKDDDCENLQVNLDGVDEAYTGDTESSDDEHRRHNTEIGGDLNEEDDSDNDDVKMELEEKHPGVKDSFPRIARRRRAELIEADDVRLKEKKEVRNAYCDIRRQIFSDVFNLTCEGDYMSYEGISTDEVEAWTPCCGKPGPTEAPLRLDMEGGLSSTWNAAVFKILISMIQDDAAEHNLLHSYPRSDTYVRELIRAGFVNGKKWWKKGRARAQETPEELQKRLEIDDEERLKRARHNVRRSEKFKRRIRTVKGKMALDRLPCWEYALSILQNLGKEGMSSDESEIEQTEASTRNIFLVKHLLWRRDIERLLRAVDDVRYLEPSGIYSPQGSKPVPRATENDPLVSCRPPPESLSPTMLDLTWAQSHRDIKGRLTGKKFTWIDYW